MTGKTKPMSQVKQLLRLIKQGYNNKKIARELGVSRNTVKSYRRKVDGQPQDIDRLLETDDPVLEKCFHAGNPAYLEKRFNDLKDRLDDMMGDLKDPHVTKKLLWEEYRSQYPEGYGYTQFCYHLSQHQKAAKPDMHLEHLPGDKLYIDFAGDQISYIERGTGEVVKCQVFVGCLPYSDYSFAIAVRSQTTQDFLYALSACLQNLGGVPRLLVPDNLKAAVNKATRYDPEINRALEDFANHYGCVVFPARVRAPQDKSSAENQVKLIYQRIYARLRKDQFFDLTSLNEAIKAKNRDHNQTRMQQHPYTREEKFLAEERSLLAPLPAVPFELKYYRDLTVAKNNHIYLAQDKHYYSVPYTQIGKKAKVIYTRSMVHIYVRGDQVAVHPRDYRPGKYTTDPDHLCSQHQHYLDRSPEYYIRQAGKKSQVLARLVTLIFEQDKHPEVLYRSCDGLMSLQRKTDPQVFEKACQIAIDNQIYVYGFISNIITNKMTENTLEEKHKPLPNHDNIRGREYFKQTTLNFNFYDNRSASITNEPA